ncbi:MAG TPA: bifunctional UDP-N-acetylglucosamine diphosphorylase/glucosamine-1-phosphate N-acetyltransferase GlmU [Myxococcota bacterium]|nr:bifunctional UDP-N-acetylglucosamine diphosphorylase/glucosamine-1-phosphate N-acetyltransferase GlmU [Myxococcota bacterium]HQK49684.1 bifunctional UDP-N-acetylglucosamine diphosphorylase/glucosamine-1-phosphate N-acetyltransferase GlmU [Myxococcota bacterium]
MAIPTAAVVLAAGLSTRMRSARPKAVHLLAGRPLACWPIQAAFEAGCDRVAVVVGHRADEVEATIRTAFPGRDLVFPRQQEPLGTAHATRCAAEAVQGFARVLVVNGDLALVQGGTLRSLLDALEASGGHFALLTGFRNDPAGFGRVVRDPEGRIARIVERRDLGPGQEGIREVNMGVYGARTDLLFRLLDGVGQARGVREFYFTDVVEAVWREGLEVGAVTLPPESDEAAQVNDRADLAQVEAALHLRHARALMLQGVTIHRPETVMIDPDCTVGPDTEVWPDVEMHRGTSVGSRCVIGRGAVLSGVRIGDDVEVKPYCVITDSTVDAEAKMGPFSHLRPDSLVGRGAHVGNFVEMKKSVLGEGSKANHLTYLGDCTVGKGANIGAGTITCNYDGVHKRPTVIEDGAFIGSDTQLVAPVTVGRGAYVAAGSTIVRDVPPDALALSRTPQVHREGWAARKREAQKKSPGGRA